jgi:hypothetical protein
MVGATSPFHSSTVRKIVFLSLTCVNDYINKSNPSPLPEGRDAVHLSTFQLPLRVRPKYHPKYHLNITLLTLHSLGGRLRLLAAKLVRPFARQKPTQFCSRRIAVSS